MLSKLSELPQVIQQKIKMPDAIITSTALCHKLMLVTRNVKDFEYLPVNLITPMD